MHIGLVYDLRDDYRNLGWDEELLAEFDQPETIDALVQALLAGGHTVERIGHGRALVQALVAGRRWDLVFNIAEGVCGRGREAQVPGLLELFSIPYLFSDATTLAISLDKGVCKRLVREAGLTTAPFVLLAQPSDLEQIDLSVPWFLKPVAEGSGKGCGAGSRVTTRQALMARYQELRARFAQPVLAERYLPGREFTVAIVGNGARIRLALVAEILWEEVASAPGVYSFATKEQSSTQVRYQLVDDPEARLALEEGVAIYRLLGCRDAGRLDFRSDALSRPHFLEINPLAGLHPGLSGFPRMAQMAGLSYDQLIQAMVDGAVGRLAGLE
ncbi:MAG: D-alanine--D-alanine ligase [Magnetococcales bacterium]|nr:D-alanine--D-alanine ligase [Magnetococcales bacterium]NGZ05339.1 D-alanine--D-alanine ligase [Magnetococcales bacterium]